MTPVLELDDVKTYYPLRQGVFSHIAGYIKAVDGVSFHINARETLGLVGESGCGKSTLGRTVIALEKACGGRIIFEGENIALYTKSQMLPVRKKMQIIFQDPYSSLNPRKTVENALEEILRVHRIVKRNEICCETDRLLELIGLSPEMRKRFPHELSGGQKQRLSIAKALCVRPDFLICDEATSSLDLSVQAQILELFKELQTKLGLSSLFISHALGVVKYISHRIAVMYLGKIVEISPSKEIFDNPLHPYTHALISANLDSDLKKREGKTFVLQGYPPSPANPPSGCRFHPRCPFKEDVCIKEEPLLKSAIGNDSEHRVACHFNISMRKNEKT